MSDINLILITGLSGAGKSLAVRALEDLDFFCVDNLPPVMLQEFVLLLRQSGVEQQERRIAVCIDIRAGVFFADLFNSLKQIDQLNIPYEILFLEASNETLIKRFKEARRPHPVSPHGRIQEGIDRERQRMEQLKAMATHIIDTSALSVHQLKAEVRSRYELRRDSSDIPVIVLSFGFKYGLPEDADLVFDVRFLPNPHWDPLLKPLSGQNSEVYNFVMAQEATVGFKSRLHDMISFLLPHYAAEGKNQLVIAIGCTGGRHRSVSLAINLVEYLKSIRINVRLEHRDIDAAEREERVT